VHWKFEMGTDTCIAHLRWELKLTLDSWDGN